MSVFNEGTLRADIVEQWGPAGAHVDVFDHLCRLAQQAVNVGKPGPIAKGWEPIDGSVIRVDDVLWACRDEQWVSLVDDVSLSVSAKWWRKGVLVSDPRWAS